MADDLALTADELAVVGDFAECNHTELVALAQELDPRACRSTSREDLLRIIAGQEIDLPERSVDAVRLYIMRFVNRNYDQLRPLLDCPAKTRDPRACFNCLDYQVVECATSSATTLFDKEEK
jgi:hypothetical protein